MLKAIASLRFLQEGRSWNKEGLKSQSICHLGVLTSLKVLRCLPRSTSLLTPVAATRNGRLTQGCIVADVHRCQTLGVFHFELGTLLHEQHGNCPSTHEHSDMQGCPPCDICGIKCQSLVDEILNDVQGPASAGSVQACCTVDVACVWTCSQNTQPPHGNKVRGGRKKDQQAVHFVQVLKCLVKHCASWIACPQVVKHIAIRIDHLGADLSTASRSSRQRHVAHDDRTSSQLSLGSGLAAST
mmetsp:Transcript_43250/g.78718  ORF Transcript_43250/g.78718 Transcript_43250/m.78718 type:complete len:242 (-) Transcript_43250:96-821(-)